MVLLLLVLALMASIQEAAMQYSCQCDDLAASGALLQRAAYRPVEVSFHKLQSQKNMGTSYQRPLGSSQIATFLGKKKKEQQRQRDAARAVDSHSQLDMCSSSQVHITLGNDDSSIVISFASKDASTPSTVETFEDLFGLKLRKSTRLFTGTSDSYSELMYLSTYLTEPAMGDPAKTKKEVADLENTSTWAFDPVTLEPWYNYRLVTTPYTGLGQYNNPFLCYESPVIHTVELKNLIAGKRYFYRVGGSCEIFEFVMPQKTVPDADASSSVYPFTIGVAADVGQTNVSVLTLNAVAALQPDIVLLPGDLSYADGWPSLWDSFGHVFQETGRQ
jgi:hypothetical protein